MQKLLVFMVFASLVALAAPSVFERYRERLLTTEVETIDLAPIVEAAEAAPPSGGRVARLRADGSGHFRTEARLNNRLVPVLVDTGATAVAIDAETARRAGIRVGPADFKDVAQTANGERKVARAVIARIDVGPVSVRDVEVMVMEGDGLPVTLLGMSFLSRLKRYEVDSGTLTLFQ